MGRGFLGFGQNLGGILPTSLPELPIQLRDLRNNQKSLKTNFVIFYNNSTTSIVFPYMPLKQISSGFLVSCICHRMSGCQHLITPKMKQTSF